MNLIRCESGHFYDSEKYGACPHCAESGESNVTVPMPQRSANDELTVAGNPNMQVTEALNGQAGSGSLKDAVKAVSEDSEKTVGFYSSAIGTEPVVGWFVCTEGPHYGEDFRLKSGRNFVGRSTGMDISITKDTTVSRERHTAVVYEPKGNLFIVQPGDSKELSYLNGDVVLSPVQIKANDRLSVGHTELMFIPCCTADFKWEIKDKQE